MRNLKIQFVLFLDRQTKKKQGNKRKKWNMTENSIKTGKNFF